MAAAANASNCFRPWMVPDKFTDADGNGTYNSPPDSYTAPGYTLADVGTELVLKEGKPQDAIAPSDFYAVDLDPSSPGAATYGNDIRSCVNITYLIGQTLQTEPGDMTGPTKNATGDLINQDPTASWNGTMVVNSNGADMTSPRIVPLALFSPVEFSNLNRNTGRFNLTIANMMGFFVEGVDNSGTVTGRIVSDVGLFTGSSTPTPAGPADFLRVPLLVR
jgi:hypothetical protein